MTPADESAPPIALDDLQRDVLLPHIQSFLEAATDQKVREVYLQLRDAVEKRAVPSPLQTRLGSIVEVGLVTGRTRRLHGPAAEQSLISLFRETPRGKEFAESIHSLNRALARLKGQPIEEVSATMRSPGTYLVTLKTAGCQIVIRFEPTGVRIESVDFDLA